MISNKIERIAKNKFCIIFHGDNNNSPLKQFSEFYDWLNKEGKKEIKKGLLNENLIKPKTRIWIKLESVKEGSIIAMFVAGFVGAAGAALFDYIYKKIKNKIEKKDEDNETN